MDNPEPHSLMWPMKNRHTASSAHPIGRRAVLLGMAAVSGSVVTGAARARTVVDLEKALAPRIIGSPDAPIHMAEYFSLTCGHCADFHQGTFKRIRTEWIDTGRLRFEYRDFPLSGLALYAHALARFAPPEAYEEMLEVLFKRQSRWAVSDTPIDELVKVAKIAGISRESFIEMLTDRNYLEEIVYIRQAGIDGWNIESTPSFVVNDKDVIVGNVDYGKFLAVFEKYSA